jgi:hypothetical protein
MRKITLAIVAAFIVGTVFGIPTDSLFLKMPDNLLPTLARKQRYELAEYFKAGKADSVANLFGRNAILQKYDTANCHIVLKTSATGTTEIKKFTFSINENVIGVIQTVSLPVKFSNIEFFTEDWQSFILMVEMPDYRNWINEKQLLESGLQSAWVENLLQKQYFSMHFTESNELEIENNVLSTLSMEDRKMVEPFFVNKTIPIKFVK